MATIDFSKTKVFNGTMNRNFQGVAIESDSITGECTVALNFGIKGIWFPAMSNGEAITASLTTGTATGSGLFGKVRPTYNISWHSVMGFLGR